MLDCLSMALNISTRPRRIMAPFSPFSMSCISLVSFAGSTGRFWLGTCLTWSSRALRAFFTWIESRHACGMRASLKCVRREAKTFLTDFGLLWDSTTYSINAQIRRMSGLSYLLRALFEKSVYIFSALCLFVTVPGLWAASCLLSAFLKYAAMGPVQTKSI